MNNVNALCGIAYRDLTKLLRDKVRIGASFIFPVLFIGALGGSLQANWGDKLGYNLLTFVFTGVFAQTLFQSTASGIISLVEDRANDFSQEMFVAPVSKYIIILGKIFGETLVSSVQGVAIVIFALLIGIPLSVQQLILLIPVGIISCFLGGSFGLIIMANIKAERTANQIFPFIVFPQLFLAGIFNPIKDLPSILFILSRIAPMTYAVDFARGIYYFGSSEYEQIVLHSPLFNFLVILGFFVTFLVLGTILFVRNEKRK